MRRARSLWARGTAVFGTGNVLAAAAAFGVVLSLLV